MAKHRTGHILKRGSNFYCRWIINGKVFSKALRGPNGEPITNRREAEEAKTKLMAPFLVGDETSALESIVGKLEGRKAEQAQIEQAKNPAPLISEAWAAFIQSPNRPDSGQKTLYQYRCQFSAFVDWMAKSHPAAITLREVTQRIAEDYTSHLNSARVSPNTYNKHLNLLTLVFRVLKRKAQLTGNPWDDIQRKRLVTHSRRELTIDELRQVCQTASGELQTLFALGIYSGLRLGDCATLRWAEVDLHRAIIRRIPNKSARRNPKPVLLPIHPVLAEMLATTPIGERGAYVLPETAALYLRRIDLVTDQVQKHFEKCGLKLHRPGTGTEGKRAVIEVGFHSLRHSFVSMCRSSNVPLSVVERGVIILKPTKAHGIYELKLAKRGNRAGWLEPDSRTKSITKTIGHGENGLIYWREVNSAEAAKARIAPGKSKEDVLALVPMAGTIDKKALISKAQTKGIGKDKARGFIAELMGAEFIYEWRTKRSGTNALVGLGRKKQPTD